MGVLTGLDYVVFYERVCGPAVERKVCPAVYLESAGVVEEPGGNVSQRPVIMYREMMLLKPTQRHFDGVGKIEHCDLGTYMSRPGRYPFPTTKFPPGLLSHVTLKFPPALLLKSTSA